MNQETINRIVYVLKDNMDSSIGRMAVCRMLRAMGDCEAEVFAEELELMASCRNYISEGESVDIVANFVNFDGSEGCHWDDPELLMEAVGSLGICTEMDGKYNKWAFFATMNMVWSDEWGVLKNYVSPNDEVKVIAELTVARLTDMDGGFNVRRYFGLD